MLVTRFADQHWQLLVQRWVPHIPEPRLEILLDPGLEPPFALSKEDCFLLPIANIQYYILEC